ncbi:RhuM family protein [Corynebacterium mastitidis]|uniref:RhuM family protein n=1 Tax=Corynebacterium mastitidis TaxID=161890 RepID=UPI00254E1E80|nr:RhuM family protein [Corynebacterium mastitidis]MDK8451512.1 RhuM family protein [Corynebacterium mastitidis]
MPSATITTRTAHEQLGSSRPCRISCTTPSPGRPSVRCEPTADNLGLTTWSGNQVRKKDIATAKNYLTHEELNRLVSQFLDFAESQAKRRIVTHMDQCLDKADQFIEFNAYQALTDSGRTAMQQAKALAEERYAIYDAQRRALEENRLAEEDLLRLQEIERQILADRQRLSPRRKH